MGWLSKIFNKRQTAPYLPEIQIEPFAYTGGIAVTPDRARTYSAVYRATALISQTIGWLPWSVLRDMRQEWDHPVHYLLHSRPCKEMSASCFKETLVRDALIWGNGYAEIEFSRNGQPRALWRLLPSRMQIFRSEKSLDVFYRYFTFDGRVYELPQSRIFHLKGLGDGLIGDSIVGYAAKSIAAGISSEETNNKLMENQLVPAGIITHPGKLSVEAAERLKAQFASKYMGRENAGKPLLMEEGMTFTPVTIRPEDAQFLESRRFSIEEIARWFGVPPHKLADLEHATFSNIEHQSQEFVNDCLMPWCKKLEEEADYKLLRGSANGYYTKIDVR
ncbi:MAG: phage portal protein, partial [Desulfovibrio sp.]|nr:phage portal protein [Desulfovibrio sp.]